MSQTSLASIVRGVASMDISQDDIKPKPAHKPATTQGSHSRQNSVSKLLTKYAKPNPFQPTSQSNAVRLALLSHAQAQQTPQTLGASSIKGQPTTAPPSPVKDTKLLGGEIDIGKYDGGFEVENAEGRGEFVYGEAAKALALDSSQA